VRTAAAKTRQIELGPATCNAILAHTTGPEHIFNRIWFAPYLIDCDFIVENRTYEIKIWNAFEKTAISVTAIDKIDPEGTKLSHTNLPVTIAPGGEQIFTLTVHANGPAIQQTRYLFTINAKVYETLITGLRVLPVLPEPDWGKNVTLNLFFETVIATGDRLQEQRRALLTRPARSVKVELLLTGEKAQTQKNTFLFGTDKTFATPLYPELMTPKDKVTGSTALTMNEELSCFWNLNNACRFVIVVDHEEQKGEIKEIVRIEGNTIILASPINGQYPKNRTYIYPAYIGKLKSVETRTLTDTVDRIAVVFDEYLYSESFAPFEPVFIQGPKDDLASLGATRIFPLELNWATQPTTTQNLVRRNYRYPGTAELLESTTNHAPVAVTGTCSAFSPKQIHTLTSFFCGRKGRFERFWFMSPRSGFTLKYIAKKGASALVCSGNRASWVFHQYDRIYILMADGALITRQLSSCTNDPVTSEITLLFDPPLDREVNLLNHIRIGRLALMRFDHDELSISFDTTLAGNANVKFTELTGENEYHDI